MVLQCVREYADNRSCVRKVVDVAFRKLVESSSERGQWQLLPIERVIVAGRRCCSVMQAASTQKLPKASCVK